MGDAGGIPTRSSRWTSRIPGLDRRAIALFRISLGCVLLLDLLLFKLPNVSGFYGPSGVFEHYYAAMAAVRPLWANAFYGLSSDAAAYGWFAASGLVYALFTLGVRARLLAVLAFLFYSATSLGNPAVRTPDDLLFGYALFWALLLPV